MKKLWLPALITVALLLLTVVPSESDAEETEGVSVAYDGTTYKYVRFLKDGTYYCEMTSFEAGTDTFMRVHSRLEGYPVYKMDDKVLSESAAVTIFVIPAEVKEMGSSIFEGCTSLKEIIFLGSMPAFKSDTFTGVPSGVVVKYLERNASSWTGFTVLEKAVLPVYAYEGNGFSFEYCEMDGSVTVLRQIKGTEITIPSKLDVGDKSLDVKYIGDSAFFYDENGNLDKITKVTLNEGLVQIGIAAFKYCQYLESITFPSTLKVIYDEAFRTVNVYHPNWQDEGMLKSVDLPEGLEYIGFEAFRMCNSLTTVTVPDTVTFYGDGAFRACVRLETINLGKGVSMLGESSFDNCYSLKNVNVPDTLTSIGHDCFQGDRSLTSFNVPDSVESIGDNAFNGCTAFSQIYLSDNTTLGKNCFYNTNLMTVGITSGSGSGIINTYLSNGGWMMPGMSTGTKISLLVIDTEDPISIDITGTVSGFIKLTDKSTNTTGGTYMSGTQVLTGADRAGKSYGTDSGIWKTEEIATVTFVSNNVSLGTLNIRGGTYVKETVLTVIAEPMKYKKFVKWSDGNTNTSRTVVVSEDLFLTAIFEDAETRTIKIVVNPEGSGTYSGAGLHVVGTTANLSVSPDEGYHLISWDDGYTDYNREVIVTEDRTFTVSFGNITITFDTNGGTIPIGPLYSNDGWKLTLPESPEVKDGKKIVSWTIDGTKYAVGTEYEVHGPVTATAVWGSNDEGGSEFPWIWVVVAAVIVVAAIIAWRYLSSRNKED